MKERLMIWKLYSRFIIQFWKLVILSMAFILSISPSVPGGFSDKCLQRGQAVHPFFFRDCYQSRLVFSSELTFWIDVDSCVELDFSGCITGRPQRELFWIKRSGICMLQISNQLRSCTCHCQMHQTINIEQEVQASTTMITSAANVIWSSLRVVLSALYCSLSRAISDSCCCVCPWDADLNSWSWPSSCKTRDLALCAASSFSESKVSQS